MLDYLTFTNLALFAIALLLFCIWRTPKYKNLPPGPMGVPFLGCLPFMEILAERTFTKWSKKYGPIITVQLGDHRTVILNSYEAIEEAFIKKGEKFNGRFKTYLSEFANENLGMIFIDGEKWKEHRKFGTRALAGAGMYGKTIEQRVLEEAENICHVIRSKNEEPFILEDHLILSVANVINGITIRERCDEEGNENLLKYAAIVVDGFRKNGLIYSLLSVIPWCRFLPQTQKQMKSMKDGLRTGNALFDNLIEQHQQQHDRLHPRDLIDLYLNQMKDFYKPQLRYFLKDLFAAGTETSSSTIRWALFYLIANPDIQDKVHEEIDDVIGHNGVVRYDTKLPYTKAVLQETYRIRTATPLGVPRRNTEDVTLMGYFIPKNTQIIPNLWWVHNDPMYWNEPDVFKPERHLDEEGNLIMSNRVMPFSIGARHCLGENLARTEIFLFLVSILQKFTVLPNPEDPNPPLECCPGIVNSPHKYPLIMKER
ncbi:cytochrome P450 2J2-like [Ciona intestinalis]